MALPVGNPLWTFIRGRVDLRNHRKLLIVDNRIAWCGSQNVADPEFRIKPRYAPWVDIMSRWEGPVARHCQYLFVSDWMGEGGDDISALLTEPRPAEAAARSSRRSSAPARPSSFDAMPACFAELIHSARAGAGRHDALFRARRATAVRADLGRAARRANDHAASPSATTASDRRRHQPKLLPGPDRRRRRRSTNIARGLLHAKTMVVDRRVGLIGSANLDRRSFELNFENNILFADRALRRRGPRPAGRISGRLRPRSRARTSTSFGIARAAVAEQPGDDEPDPLIGRSSRRFLRA